MIAAVQNVAATCHPAAGDTLRGLAGIVTAIDATPTTYAFFFQNSQGGAFSGVEVVTGGVNTVSTLGLTVGDSVVVEFGKINEVGGSTQIGAPNGSTSSPDLVLRRTTAGHALPLYVNGVATDFKESNANAHAETYEGCRVRLIGPVTIVRSGGLLGPNNFLVVSSATPADSVFVDGSSLATIASPPLGTVLAEVRGILAQRPRGYRIEVRTAADLAITPTPLAAYAVAPNQVRVEFDINITPASAQDETNYSLASLRTVLSATLVGGAGRIVLLQIESGLAAGDDEVVTVANVVAQATGHPMPSPRSLPFVNGVLTCAQVQQMQSASDDSSVFAGRLCTVRATCTGSNAPAQFPTVAYIQDAVGGTFSGLALVDLPATLGLGDDVTVSGVVREIGGRTSLDSVVFVQENGVTAVPAPRALNLADLAAGLVGGTPVNRAGLSPEPWECVLVRVTGGTVASVDLGPTTWLLTAGSDTCLAGDHTTAGLGYFPNPGDVMTLTGICDPTTGPYAVLPRISSDIDVTSGAPVDSLRWRRLLFAEDANIRTVQALADSFFTAHPEFDDVDEGDWKFYQRWLWFWMSRSDSTASYRAADVGLYNYLQGGSPSPSARPAPQHVTSGDEGQWKPLGPFVTPTPEQTGCVSTGMGIIVALTVNPVNTAEIYAGSNTGGIWRTVNGGLTWANLNANIYTSGVQDIAVDYSTSPRTIYIATGVSSFGKNYGFGVLKSCDGGVSWQCSFPGLGQNPVQSEVSTMRVILNPANSSELYAVTSTTVYRSIDFGDNWGPLFTSPQDEFKDAELLPGAFNTLFVGGKTLWRYDGAATNLTTGLKSAIQAAINQNVTIVRIEVASIPGNPATLYCLVATTTGRSILLTTTNQGATWAFVNSQNGLPLGYWCMSMAVSSADPSIIYQAGVVPLKSTDGGVNYDQIGSCIWSTGYYVHDDVRVVVLIPGSSTEVYLGHDGGVSRSTDGGATWTDISNGLVVTQPFGVASTIDNTTLMTGNQDLGIERYDVAGLSWTNPRRVGDAYTILTDPTDADVAYALTNGGANGIVKTIDKGHTWTGIPSPAGLANTVRPFLIDPQDPTTLLIGHHDVFRRTGNSAWSQISHFDADFQVSSLGRLQSIAVAPSDHDVLYTCYTTPTWNYPNPAEKVVFKTSNASAATPTWEDISANLTDAGGGSLLWWTTLTALLVHPDDHKTVYASFGGYGSYRVVKSTDGGLTWANLSEGLPAMPVNCIAFERGGNDGLYVGTDVGVYYRNADLSSWIDFTSGMGAMIVSDLDINYAANKIRAAAFGRGVWESPLYNAYSTVNGPDGFIRDSYVDIGDQPDTQTGEVMWTSPDIWVRNEPDTPDAFGPPYRYAHENQHEEPQYDTDTKPRVYVRVANRGLQPVSGTVQLYWAQASTGLTWPDSWTNGTTGAVVGPQSPTSITLAPGQVWVVERPWDNMPDPDVFGDQHFCLLARFVADTGDPLTTEVASVWENTSQNNNIAWKNVTVLPLTGKMEGGLQVRNGRGVAATLSLRFTVPAAEAADPFLAHGVFEVDLGAVLYARWVAAGSQGTNVTPAGGTLLRILDTDASIGGLAFEAGESRRIAPAFEMQDTSCTLVGRSFRVEVAQFADGATTPDGGEEYRVSPKGLPCQVVSVPGGVSGIPPRAYLSPGRPNPVVQSTTLEFGLPRPGHVEVRVYDIGGRVVRSLVSGDFAPGRHEARWDGRDRQGRRARSGVYFCELRTAEGRISRRLILLP